MDEFPMGLNEVQWAPVVALLATMDGTESFSDFALPAVVRRTMRMVFKWRTLQQMGVPLRQAFSLYTGFATIAYRQ